MLQQQCNRRANLSDRDFEGLGDRKAIAVFQIATSPFILQHEPSTKLPDTLRCARMDKLWSIAIVLILPPTASAGSIGADILRVRAGDLKVQGARVHQQDWLITAERMKVTFTVSGAKRFVVSITEMEITADDFEDFTMLASLNKQPGFVERSELKLRNARFQRRVIKEFDKQRQLHILQSHWDIESNTADKVTLEIIWQPPFAGADGFDKNDYKHFCVDAGTAKAFRKKRADGYTGVDWIVGEQMKDPISLTLKRDRGLPISLCASGVKKLGPNKFKLQGRKSFQLKEGALPIMFTLQI